MAEKISPVKLEEAKSIVRKAGFTAVAAVTFAAANPQIVRAQESTNNPDEVTGKIVPIAIGLMVAIPAALLGLRLLTGSQQRDTQVMALQRKAKMAKSLNLKDQEEAVATFGRQMRDQLSKMNSGDIDKMISAKNLGLEARGPLPTLDKIGQRVRRKRSQQS